MRWHYEQVSFEPGGKDHSSPGSSYETGKQILPAIWGNIPPTYQVYEWIGIKGLGGKMSSSKGKLILPRDAMEIYEPEIIKWLFAGTRPNREFSIGFDLDVLKIYEDFDKCVIQLHKAMAREGIVCFVVGNRTVKGINIPTDKIMAELFHSHGEYEDIATHTRTIPNKRMPKENSPTNIKGEKVTTMNNEFIFVLRKL